MQILPNTLLHYFSGTIALSQKTSMGTEKSLSKTLEDTMGTIRVEMERTKRDIGVLLNEKLEEHQENMEKNMSSLSQMVKKL